MRMRPEPPLLQTLRKQPTENIPQILALLVHAAHHVHALRDPLGNLSVPAFFRRVVFGWEHLDVRAGAAGDGDDGVDVGALGELDCVGADC